MSDLDLQRGSITLRSTGPITFGPDGVLFVADNAAATIHAIDVGDAGAAAGAEPFDLEHVDERVASYLGAAVSDVAIQDLAVHPVTHNVYLSVQRGHGDDAAGVLVRIDHLDGSVERRRPRRRADRVGHARRRARRGGRPQRHHAPHRRQGEELTFGDRTIRILKRPIRMATVTDLACVGDALFVAGLSNEEFASKLRRIPLPVRERRRPANNLEIFHVSHGQVGDGGAHPHVRPVRGRAEHPGQLHLHAGRALLARRRRARTRRSSVARSPSWAR